MVDVLRGFAAISVVVYHVIEHFGWKQFPWAGWLSWFRVGWMGVDLFFVISGFVIALSAFARIERDGPAGFRLPFLRQRLARIAPLHYLTCAVFVVLVQPALLYATGFPAQVATHLLFVHNFWRDHHGGINGVNWSVATEMQFYVLMLLAAPWLLRARGWTIAVAGVAAAWVWRACAFAVVSTHGDWGVVPLWQAATQLPGMLDEFALGVLLARFVRSAAGRRVLAAAGWPRLILPLVAAGLSWAMLLVYWQHATFWNSAAMVVLFRSCIAVCAAAWVLAAATLDQPLLLRLAAPLRYLGTISYGIYLWHLPIVLSLHRLPWLTGRQALPWVLTLTVLAASLSWHCFERPFLARAARRGGSRDGASARAPAAAAAAV